MHVNFIFSAAQHTCVAVPFEGLASLRLPFRVIWSRCPAPPEMTLLSEVSRRLGVLSAWLAATNPIVSSVRLKRRPADFTKPRLPVPIPPSTFEVALHGAIDTLRLTWGLPPWLTALSASSPLSRATWNKSSLFPSIPRHFRDRLSTFRRAVFGFVSAKKVSGTRRANAMPIGPIRHVAIVLWMEEFYYGHDVRNVAV
jgi:hypothetical protein